MTEKWNEMKWNEMTWERVRERRVASWRVLPEWNSGNLELLRKVQEIPTLSITDTSPQSTRVDLETTVIAVANVLLSELSRLKFRP